MQPVDFIGFGGVVGYLNSYSKSSLSMHSWSRIESL